MKTVILWVLWTISGLALLIAFPWLILLGLAYLLLGDGVLGDLLEEWRNAREERLEERHRMKWLESLTPEELQAFIEKSRL